MCRRSLIYISAKSHRQAGGGREGKRIKILDLGKFTRQYRARHLDMA